MKLRARLSFIILLSSYFCYSQEYSYTHYDINEGLAGSAVHSIIQDKQGFMWIGTETGLSRFDGTHFLNYTEEDGLPDIEILHLFCDSRGRVWMAPYNRSICYYYRGKIYNQTNDSMLKKLHLNSFVTNFAEDHAGNILVQRSDQLYSISPDGAVRQYDSIGNRPVRKCGAISVDTLGQFLVQESDTVYALSQSGFIPQYPVTNLHFWGLATLITGRWAIWNRPLDSLSIRTIVSGRYSTMPFPKGLMTMSIMGDSALYLCGPDGAKEYDLRSLEKGPRREYLHGIEISRVFRDNEGSLWFSTTGQGVYRLNSDEFRNLSLNAGSVQKCPVYSILRNGNSLYLGSSRSLIFKLRLPEMEISRIVKVTTIDHNNVTFIGWGDGRLAFGLNQQLGSAAADLSSYRTISSHVKTGFVKNDKEFLITGVHGCISFDFKTLQRRDTIFYGRTSTLYHWNDSTLIGTLNGLYLVKKDKTYQYLGEKIPFLRKRIAAIAVSKDGTAWVATYDNGVAGYKDGKLTAFINRQKGLTSNICRTLLVHDDFLWVGTDKGLNRIDLGKPGYPITYYTSNDGLGSDIVNTVYADSGMIYVGTPAGLSYFDESRTINNTGCHLLFLGLINSGTNRMADSSGLLLAYKQNNIRFEYVGISYKSVGNISYRYRLMGLDSDWRTTKETFLDYPILPSGDYEFQLEAINKFGVRSDRMFIRFTVETPFWRSGSFYGLVLLVFISLTWLFVSLRIRSIRSKQQEKDKLTKRMAEIEHMALQAQMNPHFIFNCLNSVQQYIFDQDIFSANKYISGLAKLIRMTLQNSSKTHISLEDEIQYLSAYLSLEKLRFKDKMSYRIEVDPSLRRSAEQIAIPPMIIQPYVENSMRHGIRHKMDNTGNILVSIMPAGDHWEIVVEDNGIGREKAASFKTAEHIEYQSKGMSLTMDRIRLINSVAGAVIRAEIIDLKDDTGNATGTRVVVQFHHYGPNSDIADG